MASLQDPYPDVVPVQEAVRAFAATNGLTYTGPRFVDRIYAEGRTAAAGGRSVEVLRSVRFHERAVCVRVSAGPLGEWAGPPLADADRQIGGMGLEVTAPSDDPSRLLASHPKSQADLWSLGPDDLLLWVRPDAVVGHLATPKVTPDVLQRLVLALVVIAHEVEERNAHYEATVRPTVRYDVIIAAAVLGGIAFLLTLYFVGIVLL